jgi:hypothetical protein
MRKELNILVILFVLAVTPLAIFFSQQQQTTQQRANEPVPTQVVPTTSPTEIPLITPTSEPTPTVTGLKNSKITPYPTFTPAAAH